MQSIQLVSRLRLVRVGVQEILKLRPSPGTYVPHQPDIAERFVEDSSTRLPARAYEQVVRYRRCCEDDSW